MELLRSLLTHPAVGVLQVPDDLGERGLGGEAIVDTNDGETGVEIALKLTFADSVSVAADESAAVNPEDDGTNNRVTCPVNIELDLARANRFVNDRGFLG